MNIEFYNNVSDNKVLNKTLKSVKTITGFFRDPFDFVNPVFFIDRAASSFPEAFPNYCKINGYYYYINDWQLSTTNYWRVSCHMDVLMSYATGIQNSYAVITRQENSYNTYLNDPLTQTQQKSDVSTIALHGASLSPTFCLVTTGGGTTEPPPDPPSS